MAAADRIAPGAFVAVVGPSGAGKDAVIGWAREHFAGAGPRFARRSITRPAGPGEDHLPVSAAEFEAAERAGAFALSWRAHGLAYGIPAGVREEVGLGRVVVANLSRGVLASLDEVFGEAGRVVRVTAPADVRRARLAARGRESRAEAEARLARAAPAPHRPADLEIVNAGALEDAGGRLVAFLAALAADGGGA